MDKESQTCGLCSIGFNTSDRTPRILINCGHTLCSHCLTKMINTSNLRKCPFDDFTFNAEEISLDKFHLNFALLALLEGQKRNICQVHGRELTDICFQDKVEICSECALSGEHKGHKIKMIKKLRAKRIQAKKELEEGLMKFEENQLEEDQYVETLKNRSLGRVGSKVGEINKTLKEKHPVWRKQIESLFERTASRSLLKEEAYKAIEEIDQACQNEEYLSLLDRDFNSIISRLQPQVAKKEVSRLFEQTSRVISSLESLLANQAKLLRDFDLSSEESKSEESMIEEEIPDQKQQQRSSENSAEATVSFKSILQFKTPCNILKIWVRNKSPTDYTVNLHKLNKIKTVNVIFQEYESLFQDSNELNSLPQILSQPNNYTSQIVQFGSSGLTDDRALSLLNLLFPRIQQLTEISTSFEGLQITNEPISFFCTEILPKATSLEDLTLKLGSTRISDFSISPLNKSLDAFKLEARNTQITDDCIEKILQTVKGVKELSLCLRRTKITDHSLKALGNNPCMKNLKKFLFDVSETEITMEGVDAIFTGVPKDICELVLNFRGISLSDRVVSLFEEKVCPKLELVENVIVKLEGKELEDKLSEILMPIKEEAEKRRDAHNSARRGEKSEK